MGTSVCVCTVPRLPLSFTGVRGEVQPTQRLPLLFSSTFPHPPSGLTKEPSCVCIHMELASGQAVSLLTFKCFLPMLSFDNLLTPALGCSAHWYGQAVGREAVKILLAFLFVAPQTPPVPRATYSSATKLALSLLLILSGEPRTDLLCLSASQDAACFPTLPPLHVTFCTSPSPLVKAHPQPSRPVSSPPGNLRFPVSVAAAARLPLSPRSFPEAITSPVDSWPGVGHSLLVFPLSTSFQVPPSFKSLASHQAQCSCSMSLS